MLTIAITGGIACGKTLVGNLFTRCGIPVCDADSVTHRLLADNIQVRQALNLRFGDQIMDQNGAVNRAILAELVFRDGIALRWLNGYLHPRIRACLNGWQDTMRSDGHTICAALIPLLFEAGFETDWNLSICVVSSPEQQLQRLQDRGMSSDQANQRMCVQMPVVEKLLKSDYGILNSESRALLRMQTEWVIKQIQEKYNG